MLNPKVSIIIPVYNGGNFLKNSIISALDQTYDNIEVIVVNDGSKDNGITKKIAQSFGNKIIYLYKENGGVSTALNLGIKKMSGDFFSWLSHDDLYYPNKIEEQVKLLKSCSNKIIASCNYQFINEKGIKINDSCIKQEYYDNLLYNIFIKKYPLYGCGLLINKEAFEICGDFNISLKCTQDYDLWLRFIENGYEFRFQNQILTAYRKHGEQGTNENGLLHKRCILEESNLYLKYLFRIGTKKIFKNTDNSYLKVIIPIFSGYVIVVLKLIGIHKYIFPFWRKYILKNK